MDAKKFESDLDKLYKLKVKMGNAERSGHKYAMNNMLNAINSVLSLPRTMAVPDELGGLRESAIEQVGKASDIIGEHAYPTPPLQIPSAESDARIVIGQQADSIRAVLNEFERVGFEWINSQSNL